MFGRNRGAKRRAGRRGRRLVRGGEEPSGLEKIREENIEVVEEYCECWKEYRDGDVHDGHAATRRAEVERDFGRYKKQTKLLVVLFFPPLEDPFRCILEEKHDFKRALAITPATRRRISLVDGNEGLGLPSQ